MRKAKNLSIVRLRLMAAPVTLELEGAAALSSSSSSSGSSSLSDSKMVCSSMVSQPAAGASAGWSAWETKSCLASCISCACVTSRAISSSDSQLTHADFRRSILFRTWTVAFSAHTTLLLFRCVREKSNVVLMFWPSTTLSAKLSLAAAASGCHAVWQGPPSSHFRMDIARSHNACLFGFPALAFGGGQGSPNPSHTSVCHVRSSSSRGTGNENPEGAGFKKSRNDAT